MESVAESDVRSFKRTRMWGS